jgi:acyl-CoA dehydrogenase
MDAAREDDTLRLLRESVQRFVDNEVLPHGAAWEEQGFVPREVLRKMGGLGFLGLRHPEQYGGSGLDARATAVLAEELGRSSYGGYAITVLVHTDMASPHLANAGSTAQLERYLPAVIAGEKITAVAVTEPDAGSDVRAIRTTARRDGDEYVLNGPKMYITTGVNAAGRKRKNFA